MNNSNMDLVKETRMGFDQETMNEIIDNIYHYLCKHKEYLNGLNVFPVPDGDTGLNMVLTLQGAIAHIQKSEKTYIHSGEYLEDFAEQMLLNSRGCSGVILSLFTQGFTQITANNDFSKENIYRAIENGYQNAYNGTENPREGTMLTLMRALKEKYADLMHLHDNPWTIIQQTIPYLKKVLDQTPDMLPVLKQAGVVDSGGAGFVVMLEGLDKELSFYIDGGIPIQKLLKTGRAIQKLLKKRILELHKNRTTTSVLNFDISKIHNRRLAEVFQNAKILLSNLHLNHNGYGKTINREKIIGDLQEIDNSWNPEIKEKFCTEFVLETTQIVNKDDLKAKLAHFGDSLIIVNSNEKYKVHIHTNKPKELFDVVSKYGTLLFTKVDDMKKQHHNFISGDVENYERDKSVFCIVSGNGFADILKNLGADDILYYGKNKPSVNQLVKKLNDLKAKNIMAAADDNDILMALKYAASLCKSQVYIVESDNPISLINILMSISKDYDIHTTFETAMNNLENIPFCSIAQSSREVLTEDGSAVHKGDFFAVYRKKIVLANPDKEKLLTDVIEKIAASNSLVTFYKGAKVRNEERLVNQLKEKFPQLEFEEYYGGQFNYLYYITFE